MSNQNLEAIYPLSPAQQGMLLYLLLTGARSEVYFDQYVATLGETDPDALRRAWRRLVDRHAVLRTLFVWEKRDQPLQVVRRTVELPWQERDWRDLSPADRQPALEAFLEEDRALGFDPGKAPLLRVALIRWSDEEWKLVWSFSHLILDGWSMALVLGDLQAIYLAEREGREPELAPVRPFGDYIAWLKSQDLKQAGERWRLALAGFEPPTPLPFDATGTPQESGGQIALEAERHIPAATVDRLQLLARRFQITTNTLFQGFWGLLLGRWSHVEDVVYGGIVSGRPHEIDGVEEMVGLFINALPIRVQVRLDAGLIPWLQQLQADQFEQREVEHCTLEQILVWAGMPRHVPLFESLLVFENYPLDSLGRSAGAELALQVRDVNLKESGNYPLTLYVAPRGRDMALKLSYHLDRFGDASARRLLDGLAALAEGALERPESPLGELSLLTAAERRELVAGAAGRPAGHPAVPVHRLFAEQAVRTPEAPAVAWSGGEVTYRELARAAGLLAGRLRALGTGAESLVSLCAERSPEMIAAMLGVLEAGAAYLPLDPKWPAERLAFMIEDSGAEILLTQERLIPELPAVRARIERIDGLFTDPGTVEVAAVADSAHLAYVIYTSGSTGRPKGVLVGHASLAHYVRSAVEAFGIDAGDRVLQFASVSFDTSNEEIYPCLTRGGTLVLRDEEMVSSLSSFVRAVDELGVTVLDLPTAYWHEWVAEMDSAGLVFPSRLRLVILGGEQAQRDRLEIWTRTAPEQVRLVNTYGPTEATIVTTRRELGPKAESFAGDVPIGRPIDGAQGYVVGLGQELLPDGLNGELLIGGAGLARGYLGRPELTAERFIPDSLSGEAGARLYRTGDLVRRGTDGDLGFRGRTDSQVKVRGYRIELGEIETALRAIPSVRDAVVVVRDERGGGKRLVAWAVLEPGSSPTVGELRGSLQERLPDSMIPAAFGFLKELPRTPSGKVDRRAVAKFETDSGRPDLDSEYAAPRNLVEEVLVGIWSDLLGVERVGIHDDFFQLGGHSLLVAKLASRVRQALHVELPMVEVFKKPTVAALAEAAANAEKAADVPQLPPIRRASRDRDLPLSFPQERVWLLNQLSPGGNIAYNFQVTIWFQGRLDEEALRRTLEEMVRRHEVLRTSFPTVAGRPVQIIHPPGPLDLPVIDLREVPSGEREELSERLLAETTKTPFDITRAPLIRWRLLRLEDELYELIQVEHHFVHDGWSFGVMLREIKAMYSAFVAGKPSPLPEPPIQYADFAVWQREWMEGPVMDHLLAHWRSRLAGSPGVLELPTDRPRPSRVTFRGDLYLLLIPQDLYMGLRAFSRKEGFTLYMTMSAVFLTLLHRYTGQEDILLGISNANRRSRELEAMIGMVVSSLVLRGDLSGNPPVRELLERVRQINLEAYEYQDMPFDRLVQELRPERQLGRNPLFQVMFNFHDAAVPDLDFGGLRARFLVRGNRSSKMDLNVIVIPRAEQRVGEEAASGEDRHALLHWEYSTDLFDLATMKRMSQHFLALLASARSNPTTVLSELSMLTPEERQELTAAGRDAEVGISDLLVHQLVERSAAHRPGAVAVSCGASPAVTMTYAQLNARANRLAHRLRRLGCGPESRVAICLERTPDLPVALLGVLKAGCAYVPLDPAYPADRLAWVLEDSGAAIVVTQSGISLPSDRGVRRLVLDEVDLGDEDASDPAPLAGPESLAYVIYTSGSTGRPKGVAVRQRGVVNFLESMAVRPGIGPDDTLLAVTTVSFDIAGLEIFLPLSVGARVELAERATVADGRLLAERIAGSGATLMQATPATWRLLLESGWEGSSRLKVLCGGEALPADLARDLLGRVGSLWNMYGPTETTIWSAVHPVSSADPESGRAVPLGTPIANTGVYVLQRFERGLDLAPDGVPGELYIGGEGLARGYLGRPDLTAERFVPDPLAAGAGGRLYRTGDLVRRRPRDGALEFLGRVDFQVKIRGYRIELGEVESVLSAVPGVRQCVAMVREDRHGERRLVAYLVTAAESEAPTTRDLRALLAQRLPDYMVPSDFVTLERLPLSPSGKVDRKALPDLEPARPVDEAVYVAPRNPVEETLAAIWIEVLAIERVGVCDDFFALGGHSLSAARVLARVRNLLGVDLPLAVVFESRTIERMAMLVAERQMEPAHTPEPMLGGGEMAAMMASAAALSDADLDAMLGELMGEKVG